MFCRYLVILPLVRDANRHESKTMSYQEIITMLTNAGDTILITEGDYAGYTGDQIIGSCSCNATDTIGEANCDEWYEMFVTTYDCEFSDWVE